MWALFGIGLPIGALLVVTGLLSDAANRIYRNASADGSAISRLRFLISRLRPFLDRLDDAVMRVLQAARPLLQAARRHWKWPLAFLIAFIAAASLGTTARNKADQPFLYVIIGLQTLFAGLLLVLLLALFNWRSALGFLGKLVAIAALVVVLAGLTLCSQMVTQPWGFG
jgi:hypothetical protein